VSVSNFDELELIMTDNRTRTVLEYVGSPTGTIHLIRQSSWFADHVTTLCGRPVVGRGWEWGDETLSGGVATCGRCRQIAHLPKETRDAV
jgi:hypothetical protein